MKLPISTFYRLFTVQWETSCLYLREEKKQKNNAVPDPGVKFNADPVQNTGHIKSMDFSAFDMSMRMSFG
jgi:hypothetical protein